MCNDFDPPSVYEEKTVTARKHHKCCECGADIDPGGKYQVIDGLWDGEWSHFKTCSACASARNEITAMHGCVILGQMRNDLEAK